MSVEATEVISVTSVTKIFHTGVIKRKTAVEDITFDIPRGQIVGLLGANGSGKSTTMKMILGFLKPTKGEILLCGHSVDDRRSRTLLGYLPENPRFQKFMTGKNILSYYGKLVGLKGTALSQRIDYLIDLVNLKHAGNERVSGYSKGMTQRLAIAQAILHLPPVLIFDEPMSGLDPLGRIEVRKLISQVHQEIKGCTILFSSHILGDVEQLCSSVLLLRKGRLTRQSDVTSLLTGGVQRFDITVGQVPEKLKARFMRETDARVTPSGLTFGLEGVDSLLTCLAELKKEGVYVTAINSRQKNLEEALFSEREQKTENVRTAEVGT